MDLWFQVRGGVVVLLSYGSMGLMYLFRVQIHGTLMKEGQLVIGNSLAFMVNQRQAKEKRLGVCLSTLVLTTPCRGYAWVILI